MKKSIKKKSLKIIKKTKLYIFLSENQKYHIIILGGLLWVFKMLTMLIKKQM